MEQWLVGPAQARSRQLNERQVKADINSVARAGRNGSLNAAHPTRLQHWSQHMASMRRNSILPQCTTSIMQIWRTKMLHFDYSTNNEHAMVRSQATLAIAQHTGRAFAFARGPDQRTRKCFPERESPPIINATSIVRPAHMPYLAA